MADKGRDEQDEAVAPTRSTAVDDVDVAARAEAADIGNLQSPSMIDDPDAEDLTPAKMVAYYQREVAASRVAPSFTGIATRVRKDLSKDGKGPSEERVEGIVNKILGR